MTCLGRTDSNKNLRQRKPSTQRKNYFTLIIITDSSLICVNRTYQLDELCSWTWAVSGTRMRAVSKSPMPTQKCIIPKTLEEVELNVL